MRKFDVAYFTASCDKEETNAKFAKELELDYPILSDPEAKVVTAYGVKMPAVNMAKRWTFYIGKDGKILAIDKKVDMKNHAEDVVKKLGELGVDKK